VLGILRYGSNDGLSGNGGDLDLFVIVSERPDDVESLHFYVGDTPVDLNVRTLTDLQRDQPLTEIDSAIADAEILFDRNGQVAAMQQQVEAKCPKPLTEHQIAWERFCQQHVLDKVRGRLESHPTLAALLLNTNIHWLMSSYFRIRALPYTGEKNALEWLRANDPTVIEMIADFYATPSLEEKFSITQTLTDRVLAPIGGRWKPGELITFGTNDNVTNLKTKGERLFNEFILFRDK